MVIEAEGSRKNSKSKQNHFDCIHGKLEEACGMSLEPDITYREDAPESPRTLEIKLPFEPIVPFENTYVEPQVLLEVTFNPAKPSKAMRISSWLFDELGDEDLVGVLDTRTMIECYEPIHTLCEKTDAIIRRYDKGETKHNRHYYDVACIMADADCRREILDPEGGLTRFWRGRSAKLKGGELWEQEAFLLSDPARRQELKEAYEREGRIYYPAGAQRPFEDVLDDIDRCLDEYRRACEQPARNLQATE